MGPSPRKLLNCSYSDPLNRLFRFESNLTKPKGKRVKYRPNSLALEHINSCNPTNSEVINSVLLNQKVSISQKELDTLLSLPSVNFDLPITDKTPPGLLGLRGKPGSRRSNSGYIFFHIIIRGKNMWDLVMI